MQEKLREIFSLNNDTADYSEIKERIIGGSNVTGTNLCILMLAILVASIGLNMNSTAVIIGAMLISPLMGSIQAMGYSMAASDLNQFKKSGIGFLFQIMICLITSTLYFRISPISTQTSELLARTQPNVWDVLIACCGGLAGMIGVTRTEKSNVIPGVAIATALMPPLCTCGYGIAHNNMRIALGAGYLFLVNTYFIFLASVLVLVLLNIPKEGIFTAEQRKKLRRKLIVNTVLITLPSLFFAGIMVKQADTNNQSLTGFESTATVEKMIDEINILFPEIDHIKVGTLETTDSNGQLISEPNVLIYTNAKMEESKRARLEQWLKIAYDPDCIATFIYE